MQLTCDCCFCRFKMKVGSDLSDDIRRAAILRDEIGWDNFLVNTYLSSSCSLKRKKGKNIHPVFSKTRVNQMTDCIWMEEVKKTSTGKFVWQTGHQIFTMSMTVSIFLHLTDQPQGTGKMLAVVFRMHRKDRGPIFLLYNHCAWSVRCKNLPWQSSFFAGNGCKPTLGCWRGC